MRTAGRSRRSWVVLAVALVCAPAWSGDVFEVDSVHSEVSFRIRHLVSRVAGNFRTFNGTIDVNRGDLAASKVELTIDTGSIDTANERRDGHLRSADFFHVEKYPEMRFVSSKIAKSSGDMYDVTGQFSMHGVTKEITIPVEFLGFAYHPRFGEVAGFSTTFTLKRADYGIEWNMPMDADRLVLGDDVLIEINIEARKRQPDEPEVVDDEDSD